MLESGYLESAFKKIEGEASRPFRTYLKSPRILNEILKILNVEYSPHTRLGIIGYQRSLPEAEEDMSAACKRREDGRDSRRRLSARRNITNSKRKRPKNTR